MPGMCGRMTLFRDCFGTPMPLRQWVAWKLVRLAHRLHNPEHEESIIIRDPEGEIAVEFGIISDDYACGISAQMGARMPEGWTIEVMPWDDFHETAEDITDQFRGEE